MAVPATGEPRGGDDRLESIKSFSVGIDVQYHGGGVGRLLRHGRIQRHRAQVQKDESVGQRTQSWQLLSSRRRSRFVCSLLPFLSTYGAHHISVSLLTNAY